MRLINLPYKTKLNRRENETMVCSKCKCEKLFNNDNFYTSNPKAHLICRSCNKRLSQIRKYKTKYNIDLNFDKGISTYSPVEWYLKWRQGITNIMPLEIIHNPITYSEIIIYVIDKILKLDTRDKLITLNAKMLSSNGIQFGSYSKTFNIKTIYELISILYKQHNIKAFEFKQSPKNYWSDKNNCDEYMKYYIDEYIGGIDIVCNSPSEFFNVEVLAENKFISLYNCIYIQKHYTSFFEWITSLYQLATLTRNDFNEHISNDGYTQLNSRQEQIIFDFIKYDLGIHNIESIGLKRKNTFYNNVEDENYNPDFIIRGLVDKPIIIEYYGMFDENVCHGYVKEYTNKTKRKNLYFNNNGDIYFIDLYKCDITNKFEGVRRKVESLVYISPKAGV